MGLNTDTPQVELEIKKGKIQSNITIGANLSLTRPLLANEAISSRLHGKGCIVTATQAVALGLGKVEGLEQYIRHYRHGKDIADRPRGVKVVDLFGTDIDKVRTEYPAVYQHILTLVKPERDHNKREYRRKNWWLFGENIPEARKALFSVDRYITTVETSKHRFFQFLDTSILPDNKLVNIGLENAAYLAVLSSLLHCYWFQANAGKIGVYSLDSVYVKTRCFDPFPFPAFDSLPPALLETLQQLGERLDRHRKERLEEHSFLTMTSLYNVLERVRELESGCDVSALTDAERDIYQAGLVASLKEIHDEIDRATLQAYGFEDLTGALLGRPGATTPSPHKTPEQMEAEETLLSRLVALNQERMAEEKRGTVRWLRPDYQISKLGHKVAGEMKEQVEADIALPEIDTKPAWPKDGLEQFRILRELLAKAKAPMHAEALYILFSGKNTKQRQACIQKVLTTLADTGALQHHEDGRYFIPKQ